MEDNQPLNRAVVYKGCTRPAMFFGVPIIPFVIIVGGIFLLGFLIKPPFSLLAILAWWTCKELCKSDEHFFSVLYVKFITKMNNPNKKYWNAVTFQPINYRFKPKNRK